MMLSDDAVSAATEADLLWLFDSARATGAAKDPAVVAGIFDGSVRSAVLIDFIIANSSELGDLVTIPEYLDAGAGSALFLNRLCKSPAASALWMQNRDDISPLAQKIKETLDNAPDSLFSVRNSEHWDNPVTLANHSVFNCVAYLNDAGDVAYDSSGNSWASVHPREARIDICRSIIADSNSNSSYSPCVVSKGDNEIGFVPKVSGSDSLTRNIYLVAPGGLVFFRCNSPAVPFYPAINFYISGKVKYASYIAV